MNKKLKSIIAGILAGALTACTVPAIADGIEALINSVNIKLDGVEIAYVNEDYELQNGTKVPFSILYEGTTYLPVRKISELLEVGIDWDNSTRTVLIEKNNVPSVFDSWYGAPNFEEITGTKETNQVTTVNSTTHWYDVNNVTAEKEEAYKEKLIELGFKKVTEGSIRSRFNVYAKGNTEVWLDLGMYTNLVYGITVVDKTRPIVGKEYSYSGSKEDIPNFISAFGGVYDVEDGIYNITGDWSLWSSLPCYFMLLEQEGFSISKVESGYFGKAYTVKKDRTSSFIGYISSKYSNIPTLAISY